MAEFCDVIYEMKRMCDHFRPTCSGCKLCLGKGTNEFCGEQPCDIRSDPALVEDAVMEWAKANPKPVYPSWYDYLHSIGVLHKKHTASGDETEICWGYMMAPIDDDTAKKLGLQPKEE